MRKIFTLLIISLFYLNSSYAQDGGIKGKVVDFDDLFIPDVEVRVDGKQDVYKTDNTGSFSITNIPNGAYLIILHKEGYVENQIEIQVSNNEIYDLETIRLSKGVSSNDLFDSDVNDVIVISDSEFEMEAGAGDIAGLLNSSQDVFVRTAGYTFGQARFRMRGYGSEETSVFMNGIKMNDATSGRVFWSQWGGLNDVTRNKTVESNLMSHDYGYGGIGGATYINLRASEARPGLKATYSMSNKSYQNRAMVTYSTGQLDNGWSLTASGSRRWSQEGYTPASSYDAWAYYLGVEKKINNRNAISLVIYGAPSKRGKQSGSIQEVYDLTGDNHYNSYWGWQNGEKRNSRISQYHQPQAILSHYWDINDYTKLTTSVGYSFGKGGNGTALNWWKASDPRPNYYRYLPSYNYREGQIAEGDLKTQLWQNDDSYRQVNWDRLYEANIDQVPTTSGKRAHYILEDRRTDKSQFDFNTFINSYINDNTTISGGISVSSYKGHNYKMIDDLLGADYFLDIDQFVERDKPGTDNMQSDLRNPNRQVKVGDEFGYSYNINNNKYEGWAQLDVSLSNIDYYAAARASYTNLWREGLYENGNNPGDLSFGDSEILNFFNYGIKGGLTYKYDGRNYIYGNVAYETRAPFERDVFVSPRTRNQIIDDPKSVTTYSADINYEYRSPYVKARATGYFTQINDRSKVMSFYHDGLATDDDRFISGFVNYAITGMNSNYAGLEFATEVKLSSTLTAKSVIAVGQYVYTSNYNMDVTIDVDPNEKIATQEAFMKGLKVEGIPQQAFNLGLQYRSPKYWWISIDANYYDDIYLSANPARRTDDAVYGEYEGSDEYNKIVNQERLSGSFILDASVGKSWRVKGYYINLNLSVNNILNTKDFKTGGYEQLRFDTKESHDPDKFPSRYYYMYGTTFFLNMSVSL